MPQVAKIYDKGPGEHTLILNTRCQMIYPFNPATWTDLRVGFLLSVTTTAGDNDPGNAGIAESIPVVGLGPPDQFWWAGIKVNNDSLPSAGVAFIGFSNWPGSKPGNSDLVSSNNAIGAGTTHWRPTHAIGHDAVILSGSAYFLDGIDPHFAQDSGTVAAGYATLLMLRITRPSPTSKTITVRIKQGTNSGDVLFTNTPSLTVLENNLANYPTVVQSQAHPNVATVPDALYLYWPFSNSRLRCHALGFMKFS